MTRQNMRPILQDLFDLMVNCDPEGQLYQDILERNFDNFVLYKLNLKKYFTSSMPIFENSNFDTFPQFHKSKASIYIPFNLEGNQNLAEVKNKYTEIIQKAMDENERLKNIFYVLRKKIGKFCCCCFTKAKKGFDLAAEEKKKEEEKK